MSGAGSLVGVVNAGSSSLKFASYDGDAATLSGQVEGIGVRPSMKARGASGETLAPLDLGSTELASPADALVRLLPWLRSQLNGKALAAIGHRVVQGARSTLVRRASPAPCCRTWPRSRSWRRCISRTTWRRYEPPWKPRPS